MHHFLKIKGIKATESRCVEKHPPTADMKGDALWEKESPQVSKTHTDKDGGWGL